jgi:hypothetical protein
MLDKQRYQDMPASIGQLSRGSAASSGQAWAKKFLVGWSKDRFGSLYFLFSLCEGFLICFLLSHRNVQCQGCVEHILNWFY